MENSKYTFLTALMPEKNRCKDLDDDEDDDVISKAIGNFGKWQLLLTFLLSLFNIPCTWHIFVPTFHGAVKPMWCARPPGFQNVEVQTWINQTETNNDFCFTRNTTFATIDGDGNLENLGSRIKCQKWEYEGPGKTVIQEFDLVCERKTLNNMAEMMFLGGVAIGGLICGILSDKYGRKKTLMASVFAQAVLGTIISFVPYFEMYYIFRAALGFVSVSVVFSGFVLSIELVGGHWRTIAGISYLFPVALSYMSIAGIAWLLKDWRNLQLAISAPGFILLGLIWILPESPRWLLAMGKTDKVMTVLERAARVNDRELPANIDKQLLPADSDDETESVGVMDLFKTHEMRKTTLLLSFIWFSVYLVYYGLVLNLESIGGNLYINSVLSGAVELPAIAISILILLKGGRRWPLALTMILSGVACCFVLPFKFFENQLQWVVTTLFMMSKFSISSSNAIMPVFTAELYPTTLRNIGVGASNVAAGIALMAVPYLWELRYLHEALPIATLAGCGIMGGVSVLFLRETGLAPLKDTLKEVKQSNISRRESKAVSLTTS